MFLSSHSSLVGSDEALLASFSSTSGTGHSMLLSLLSVVFNVLIVLDGLSDKVKRLSAGLLASSRLLVHGLEQSLEEAFGSSESPPVSVPLSARSVLISDLRNLLVTEEALEAKFIHEASEGRLDLILSDVLITVDITDLEDDLRLPVSRELKARNIVSSFLLLARLLVVRLLSGRLFRFGSGLGRLLSRLMSSSFLLVCISFLSQFSTDLLHVALHLLSRSTVLLGLRSLGGGRSLRSMGGCKILSARRSVGSSSGYSNSD